MHTSEELQALSQALLAVTEQTQTREVLQKIVEAARTLVGADYAALGIPDDSGRFGDFYAAGITPEQWERIGTVPRVHGILGEMLRDGQAHRLADVRSEPDFSGWPDAHPDMGAFLGVPVVEAGTRLGSIWVANRAGGREFGPDDTARLEILAAHAAIALTRARLYARERELTLVEERSRIARELHDAVAQKLFSLRLTMRAADGLAAKGATERLREELASAQDLAASALDELRAVVAELRPPALREDGLVPALRKHLSVIGRAYAVEVRFDSDCDGRCALPDEVENAVFRVAQEAVHNALRHAAPRRVDVTLRTPPGQISLEVTDDGAGFDGDPAARGGHHLGLLSMKERARSMGGRLRVRSRVGEGTTVRLEVPRD
ncbi:MAG TPA: GAF domain-containing sensor histidine kinase [Actinopolymorphaceae bacterium]